MALDHPAFSPTCAAVLLGALSQLPGFRHRHRTTLQDGGTDTGRRVRQIGKREGIAIPKIVKTRGWTLFSNSSKWQRKKISYTAETSH